MPLRALTWRTLYGRAILRQMGHELELMKRLVAGWEGLDVTDDPGAFARLPFMDESFEFDLGAIGLPDEQVWTGRREVDAGWQRWLEQWDEYRIRGSNLEQHGNDVVVDVDAQAVGRGSRAPMTTHNTQVYSFENGKLVRLLVYATREEALESVSRSAPAAADAARTPPAP